MTPCLTCGRPVAAGRSRHPSCSPRPTKKTAAETRRRAAVVAAHRRVHGDWCPGFGPRPAHASTDLTADHIVEVAADGGDEHGQLQVLCRGCNSAKRHATERVIWEL